MPGKLPCECAPGWPTADYNYVVQGLSFARPFPASLWSIVLSAQFFQRCFNFSIGRAYLV